MLSLLAAVLLSTAPAAAQDCDAKALQKELAAASPVQVAPIFLRLAECSPTAAAAVAPKELLRILPGDEGDQAAVAAIDIGAGAALTTWTDAMLSSDRSRTIAALGVACDSHPKVKDFLVGAHARLGDKFWEERWFRALAACSGPEVGQILGTELDKGTGADKTRYFGVLEAYARSQGEQAVPKLEALMTRFTDEESQTYIVNAFPDAAQVGSTGGMDAKAAAAAVAALQRLAPTLSAKAVGAARVALRSMDAEQASDEMAGEFYRAVRQPDGGLLWGVIVVESASCKKGTQVWQRIHHGPVASLGNTWPDQLQEKVETSYQNAWEMSLGAKCKVEADIKTIVPAEPFADEAAFKAWRDEQLRLVEEKSADKRWRIEEAVLRI